MNERDAEQRPALAGGQRASARAAAASASSAVTVMTAFKPGLRRSIRARKCRVSSTLDNSLAASRSASSPMDRSCSITELNVRLLDDPRDEVQPRLHLRRVALIFFVVVAFRDHIRPQALVLPDQRVRHGLDVCGVDARQLVHELRRCSTGSSRTRASLDR
jgi:hypothetical protein